MERVALALAFVLALLLPPPLFARAAACDHPLASQAASQPSAAEVRDCAAR